MLNVCVPLHVQYFALFSFSTSPFDTSHFSSHLIPYLLLLFLPLHSDSFLRTLSCPCISLGSLTANRQTRSVSSASVTSNFHQSLMLRAISLLKSPSTLYSLSITSLSLLISSSVRSLTLVSGFIPVLRKISLDKVLPIPKM